MDGNILFIFITLLLTIGLLVSDKFRAENILFFTLIVFLITGQLTVQEALEGFSNEGILTILILFILAGSVQQSGIIQLLFHAFFKKKNNLKQIVTKVTIPTVILSSFLSNTAIVVLFTPIIKNWSQENKISPKKILIPLSYAAIFGGTLTLFGTSTNLIIHGLMIDHGMEGFSLFELAIISLPASVVGLLYIIFIGTKLLPYDDINETSDHSMKSDYVAELKVEESFPYIGKTVKEARLRNLNNIYLVQIIRGNQTITPVSPHDIIYKHDRLVFTGLIKSIVEIERIKGLTIETGSDLTLKQDDTELFEAIVSRDSSLLNQTIKETNFRKKHDGAITAVKRNNKKIEKKIGDIQLKPGDELLILSKKKFTSEQHHHNDFYLLSSNQAIAIPNVRKTILSFFSLTFAILLAVFNLFSLLESVSIALCFLLVTKTLNSNQIKNLIHFRIIVAASCSLGIGVVIKNSGIASYVSTSLVKSVDVFGLLVVFSLLYLVTNLLTELITNVAAASMMFPIALELSYQLSIEPLALILLITIASSASFSTPIGYQTNLIVYSAGNYRFLDFLKIGIPLNLLFMATSLLIVFYFIL